MARSGGDPGEIARALIDSNRYVVLGTADAEGRPWVSPVWYAHRDYRELYWVSRPESRHSVNVSARSEVSLVVFDSTVREGDGQAVYASALAAPVPEADVARGLETFSGGELTRASLARALSGGPDLLLLDEPTNHLDMASMEWLEQELSTIDAAVILVAHDRWFLESVGTAVLELESGRSTYFPGVQPLSRRKTRAKFRGLMPARSARHSIERSSRRCSTIHSGRSRSALDPTCCAARWVLNCDCPPGRFRKTTNRRATSSAIGRPRSSSTSASVMSIPAVTPAEV